MESLRCASKELIISLSKREVPKVTRFTNEETEAQRVNLMARVSEVGRGYIQDMNVDP